MEQFKRRRSASKWPRGSEWRKWDLHVHTPSSYDYKNKSVTNEQIIYKLVENDIKVAVITDHHKIDIKRIKELQKIGNEKEILILPGIEFRSELGGSESIHFIGIFGESSQIEDIWTDIISKCNLKDSDIEKKGNDKIYVDFVNTASLIKSLGGLVSIHAGTKSNSIENITNSLSYKMAQKEEIVQYADIFELGKKEDEQQYNKNVFPNISKRLPMILASDNHNINEYILKENCWIKADPTFEGLRQIIFEPEERVKIQKESPQNNFEKSYFSEIEVNETEIFSNDSKSQVCYLKNKIKLNRNLVTIIGGRGTGKSLLLDSIGKTFCIKDAKKKDRINEIDIPDGNFKIKFTKSDNEVIDYSIGSQNNLDYLHISQSQVKEVVDKDVSELDREIKQLLFLNNISRELIYNDSELEKLITEIVEIYEWFFEEDSNNNDIHSYKYNKNEKLKVEELISTLTTHQNQENIKKYRDNIIKIRDYDNIIDKANSLQNSIDSFISYTAVEIEKINSLLCEDDKKIKKIYLDESTNNLNELINNYKIKKDDIRRENNEIEKVFIAQGIKSDIGSLLDQIEQYQHRILNYEKIIQKYEENKKLLDQRFLFLSKIASAIEKSNENYNNQIKEKWEIIKNGKSEWSDEQKNILNDLLSDIEIYSDETFDEKNFYNALDNYVNGTKFRASNNQTRVDKMKEVFCIEDYKDIYKIFRNEKIFKIDSHEYDLKDFISESYKKDLFGKNNVKNFLRLLILERKRRDYWNIFVKSQYKDKELHQLSVGQRGTFYLSLKLATNSFLTPFIFDQPEDDLDNEFIVKELVPLFKRIKKYRQVIIVTHNANLVINADAEQIIVAENNDEKLSYVSGSIEDLNINKLICEILEGGKEAFAKRENKYGFSK